MINGIVTDTDSVQRLQNFVWEGGPEEESHRPLETAICSSVEEVARMEGAVQERWVTLGSPQHIGLRGPSCSFLPRQLRLIPARNAAFSASFAAAFNLS